MLRIMGYTPTNRRDYVVADDHKENCLLEYTLVDGNVSDVVVSIGGGRHRHYPAATVINEIQKGAQYQGLELAPGNKLIVTSPYGKYLEERACFNKNRIYSLLVGMWDIQLLGIHLFTKSEIYNDVKVPASTLTGFRVIMTRTVMDLNIAEMVGVLKSNFVPELCVINGDDIRISSELILNKIYRLHSSGISMGKNYLELVNPADVISIRESK